MRSKKFAPTSANSTPRNTSTTLPIGIPADAPHPENALRFIDYLLRPAVIAGITDAVWYPNPNLPATALVKPEIRDDPAVYPPEDIRQRLYVDFPAPPAYERARTRAWTRLKSGR